MRSVLESKRFLFWSVLLVAAGTFCLARWSGWPRSLEGVDERQHRLDVAAPVPSAELILEQSFVAGHDGLTAVELLLAVYPPGEDDVQDLPVLTLRLLDGAGEQLHAASWDVRQLTHNEPLRFTFSPLTDSAGQGYRLRLEGTAANRATVWAYSLDGYPRGELSLNGERQAGDLRFEIVYGYSLPAALRDLGRLAAEALGLLAALALLLFLPGLALLALLPVGLRDQKGCDPAVQLGLALAGSLACVALGWLWLTVLGGRWSGATLWLALAGSGALLVTGRRRQMAGARPRFSWETAALAGVLALGLALRLVAIRDLVLPAWVDSPQHYLISRMMAESGRVPSSYRPWMPVDRFWYHFGFHALTASLHLMSGRPIEGIMLLGGQIMNGLAPLSVYAGTVLLTRRRAAGLVAAFWVALLALFPAYYVAWGRYTQLSGLLLLAPLLGVAYRLFEQVDRRPSRALWRPAFWLALALGGLFVVHARVWVYALVWLAVAAGGVGFSGRRGRVRCAYGGRLAAWWGAVMGIAAGCAAPWLFRVGQLILLPLAARIGSAGGDSGYNDVPWGYVTYGWERAWLALAGLGLFWGLWRRQRPIALLGGWVAAVLALINLTESWLVNNNTWLISLYVPVSMILGWVVDDWLRRLERRPLTRWLGAVGLTAAVIWSGLYGARQMAGVVNVETVLVRPDDLALIEQVEALPADALVAVNGWQWLGEGNWAGSDGGYWLMPLTGRQSTMPPIGYGMELENRQLVNGFNQQLAEVEEWDAPESLALLRGRGVTHLFIGERGGTIRPEALLNSSHYRLLASNGAAWLFEVEGP